MNRAAAEKVQSFRAFKIRPLPASGLTWRSFDISAMYPPRSWLTVRSRQNDRMFSSSSRRALVARSATLGVALRCFDAFRSSRNPMTAMPSR